MPEFRSPLLSSDRMRDLRLALIGSSICTLGLLASLPAVGLLAGLWGFALAGSLGYAWYAMRKSSVQVGAPGVPVTPAVDSASATNGMPLPAPTSDDSTSSASARTAPDTANEGVHLLSSAGHDMRQPLQAISLFSATLAAHPLPPESAKLVGGIEQAAECLSSLFESVMGLARLSSGRVHIQPRALPLDEVLRRCVTERMDAAQEKGIHLRHVPTRLHALADERQLAHVIDNLILHALATCKPEGGGVVIGCRRQSGGVRIEIWDNGQPLSAAAMDQLFEPFSDYGRSLADRGLGVVLACRLLRAMGGELRIGRTRDGKRFVCDLPPALAS